MRENPTKIFFSHVKKTPTCWIWTGCLYHTGYGCTKLLGETVAHRVSWIVHNKTIPKGMLVLHSCDIRACVNPDHLWLGTQSDNIQDCMKKGRGFLGEIHGRAKLTTIDALEIRKSFEEGRPYTRQEGKEKREFLAKKYKVCKSAIIRIINRSSWNHLPSPTP